VRNRIIVSLVLFLFGWSGEAFAEGKRSSLSQAELLQIKRIVVQLVGTPVRDSDHVFALLVPFALNPDSVPNRTDVCGQWCHGRIRLRGGLTLVYAYPNPPKGWVLKVDDPWFTRDGRARITDVELLRGRKEQVIFSRRVFESGDA
jgi:hypothetical protein